MLASSVRESPWSDLWFTSSEARFTSSFSPSWPTVIPSAKARVSSPFGPFTFTVFPSMAIVTPFGTGIGSFRIRDMALLSLPDEGEELAARARLTGLAIRHHALRRAEDGDAQAVANARNLGGADVFPETGRRHALQLADDRLAAGVLEAHAQQLAALVAFDGRE